MEMNKSDFLPGAPFFPQREPLVIDGSVLGASGLELK
jgi:hypothetical protein